MALKVCFIAILVIFSLQKLMCQASILNPYFEDISFDFVNYSYVDSETFDVSINYKPKSRNSINVKIDLIEELPANMMIKLNVSSRVFGQEIPTGLSFESSICDNGNAKFFYDILMVPFGVKECPPEKGSYEKEDFIPDLSKVPIPLVPGTSLLIKIHMYAEGIQLLDCKAFIVA
ncbi:uncharacterized protein LOC107980647 [Nasonia vitripennis]|uniref:Uncharacterized protein n=1 Tax=Nasonia vitripennis TaxID=7425 RepID=A0A7M7IM49_NASVI|nr:uncharacterized protein LOC107980647 [Nasonia vitripennis]